MKSPLCAIGVLVLLAVLLAAVGPFLWADGADGVKHPRERTAGPQGVDVAEETGDEDWRTEASPQSYDNMEYFWETKPELRPLIEQAMSDGRLTVTEVLNVYHAKRRNSLLGVIEEETSKTE